MKDLGALSYRLFKVIFCRNITLKDYVLVRIIHGFLNIFLFFREVERRQLAVLTLLSVLLIEGV